MSEKKTTYTNGAEAWGKIQLYTGKGKGKTTAGLGTGLRAHANGKKVAFVYFDKGGEHYSEQAILDKLEVEYYRYGLDRIHPETGKFRFGVTDEDKEQGQAGLAKARELMERGDIHVLILDEVNISANLGIIEEKDVLALMDAKPEKLELIMTGRDAPESFEEKADLVTEMVLKKHYFYEKVPAREGLDY